jgi:hypothetical protein
LLPRARDREQVTAHDCYSAGVRSVDRFPAVAGEASRRCSGWPFFRADWSLLAPHFRRPWRARRRRRAT